MDYVGWVERVANTFASAALRYQQTTTIQLAIDLGLLELGESLDRYADQALDHALDDLDAMSVLHRRNNLQVFENENTRRVRHGARLESVWPSFFTPFLEPDPTAFLDALVRISLLDGEQWADTRWCTAAEVFDELGWSRTERSDITRAHEVVNVLTEPQAQFVEARRASGSVEAVLVRPTYRGVVRSTRQIENEWREGLDALVAEWETVTVDFKEQLNLRSDREKAEFIKDVLALATTKASGSERYIVIGFDDDSRAFTKPIDAKLDEDRLEDVVNAYIRPPQPRIRLIRVPMGEGDAGVFEITRDPRDLPYRVAKAIQKLRPEDVFVRHGTHSTRPSEDELADLRAEAARAEGR